MSQKQIMLARLRAQLALDYHCSPLDFDGDEPVITSAVPVKGRRMYQPQKEFFTMATLGRGAVLCAHECLHPFLAEWSRGKAGIWLFEHHNLSLLEKELNRYGQSLHPSHHMYLPEGEETGEVPVNFEVRWLETADILPLYGNPAFPNAICEQFLPHRPDVLAVAAIKAGQIIGLAGCSADAENFWQIGVDVLPPYRGKGIGTALVRLIKREVFRRGALPFYGTGPSNLHSQNIARNCGFFPAWVEVDSYAAPAPTAP